MESNRSESSTSSELKKASDNGSTPLSPDPPRNSNSPHGSPTIPAGSVSSYLATTNNPSTVSYGSGTGGQTIFPSVPAGVSQRSTPTGSYQGSGVNSYGQAGYGTPQSGMNPANPYYGLDYLQQAAAYNSYDWAKFQML